ncbi:hypothetical protein GCM10027020_22860 [Nocardioides salsibiostraticola]
MKNSIKGAIAAGGAAVILLGGAGSLAYWNDTEGIDGGTISSGNLKIDSEDCLDADWTVTNNLEKPDGALFVIDAEEIVPGDVLTKTCTIDIVAVGTNLRAILDVTGGVNADGTTMAGEAYDFESTFLRADGSAIQDSEITPADSGTSIDATITLDFKRLAVVDNDSKLKKIDLNDFTVTATQVNS